MAISTAPNSLTVCLDRAKTSGLASMLRAAGLGQVVRQATAITLRNKNPDANDPGPYQLSTLNSLVLPDDAKCQFILSAWARAGVGTLGKLTVEPYGTTPGSGQVAPAPNGDVVFLESNEWTSVDVAYLPYQMDVVELSLPVVSGTMTIPAAYTTQGVCLLMEAEILVGTHTGKCAVLVPGAAPSSTLQANLGVALTTVLFDDSDDAPTSARVKLGVCSALDVDAALEAASPVL